ncbi:MAG: outer membrane protein assembly factor BamD [Verrucomicrobiota bacterium]
MMWLRYYVIGMLLLSLVSSWAGLTWRPGEGWVDESGEALQASSAKAQLDMARDLESKENWKDAHRAYKNLLNHWPLSIYAGEAQFKIGFMLEKRGEFWPAFQSYQKVISKYPGSQFFDLAVERQYSIGMLYLSGEPQRVWKIPLLPSMNKAVEVFDSVVKAAPYGAFAAPAYFQIGQAREQQRKWSDAITAYNTILDKYPNSDWADDAQYQIGYAWLNAASEPDYDQSAAEKSIEAFEDFLLRFPNSEKVVQAKENVAKLKGRITQGAFNIAKFYEEQRNFKAAYIYYNEVVRQNPDSAQGKAAKERIEALRPQVEPESSSNSPSQPNTQTASLTDHL